MIKLNPEQQQACTTPNTIILTILTSVNEMIWSLTKIDKGRDGHMDGHLDRSYYILNNIHSFSQRLLRTSYLQYHNRINKNRAPIVFKSNCFHTLTPLILTTLQVTTIKFVQQKNKHRVIHFFSKLKSLQMIEAEFEPRLQSPEHMS